MINKKDVVIESKRCNHWESRCAGYYNGIYRLSKRKMRTGTRNRQKNNEEI